MNEIPGLLALTVHSSIGAAAAWLLTRCTLPATAGRIDQVLAWGVAALAIIAGTGELLGIIGGLGPVGFRVAPAAVLLLLAWGRGARLRSDVAALGSLGRGAREMFQAGGWEAGLAGVLAAWLLTSAGLALWTHPVVFDTLTYQLPRIGHWLQDGHIRALATDDARVNYMPDAPALVMAWLSLCSPSGFPFVALGQAVGGALAALATVGLARQVGLSRAAALGSALLLPAMANVAPQFTAVYTDLFTTGVLAASVYLWLAALRRAEGSAMGGLAAALALGSKGTVFFFGPGLALATAWLAWRHRAGRTAWARTLAAALVGAALFVLPGMVRNDRTYGGIFGPEEFVQQHLGRHQDVSGVLAKLRVNLATSFAQLFEPNSQPPWWRGPARTAGEALVRRLPEKDANAFDELDRRANLEKIFSLAAPDADVTSTGLLLPLLGLAAVVAAARRPKSSGAELVLVWAAALAGFVLFLHGRVQWHPYLFRFMVLGAPWLAVLAAWWLARLHPPVRLVAWTIVAAGSVYGWSAATFLTYQSGWPAITRPAQSFGYFIYQHWRAWSAGLDAVDEPLRPALTVNRPLAAFYRQESGRPVRPLSLTGITAASAEQLARDGGGWVIVQAGFFLGREGRVLGRTWLVEGDEHNEFSLAAYRNLRPGERPAPLVYRNRLRDAGATMRRELLVKTWDHPGVRVELFNPAPGPCHCEIRAPLGNRAVDLAPGAQTVVELAVPPEVLSLVTIDFTRPAASPAGPGMLEVGLAR